MADAADAKKVLRARMRGVLSAASTLELARHSDALCGRLAAWDGYRGARTVLSFMPVHGEPDLRPLMMAALVAGKTVCLPRADWGVRRLEPVPVSDLDSLEPGRHGIQEPPAAAGPIPLADIDLVLVPGLAFDSTGHRLGRGAGFYDRFLADPALRAQTCGVCFDGQVVPAVPAEAWDIPVKAVATDGRLIVIS